MPCVADWPVFMAERVPHRGPFEVIHAREEPIDVMQRRRVRYFAVHLQDPRRSVVLPACSR